MSARQKSVASVQGGGNRDVIQNLAMVVGGNAPRPVSRQIGEILGHFNFGLNIDFISTIILISRFYLGRASWN